MSVEFKPDHRGIGELMRSAEMHGAVELAAHEAIPFAQAISPDAPPYGEGYVDSFEVHSGMERIAGTRRAVAELANTSSYAMAVESGWSLEHGQWGNHPGYHVLGITADLITHGSQQ